MDSVESIQTEKSWRQKVSLPASAFFKNIFSF